MTSRNLDIGIVTDEISSALDEALELGQAWGIHHFEIREGRQARYPQLTREEQVLVEKVIRDGAQITAVSPGIFKGAIENKDLLTYELERVLPESLDLADRFQCSTVIVFGFERCDGESERNRVQVLRAFETAAELADHAGQRVIVENEPGFWIDRPTTAAALLAELDHPAMRFNWDPANVLWGGQVPDREGFEAIRPFLANLHVKDHDPSDQKDVWKPIGKGKVPWETLLTWVYEETTLSHITLETHCQPLIENTQMSLDVLRDIRDLLVRRG